MLLGLEELHCPMQHFTQMSWQPFKHIDFPVRYTKRQQRKQKVGSQEILVLGLLHKRQASPGQVTRLFLKPSLFISRIIMQSWWRGGTLTLDISHNLVTLLGCEAYMG